MKIKNHYVPQVYLKQWENKKRIYTYEVLVPNKKCPIWKTESIRRTSSVDYLYIYKENNELTEELENFFSEIENYYQTFMDKVNNNTELTLQDFKYISKLIASQHLRTIAGYLRCKNIILKQFGNVVTKTVEKMITEIENGSLFENKFESIKEE